ncbi:MAG: twin-arginine translocase TatA/TatE family subunit [Rubrobacteraceae bacterium]|nr:twin-arginine translocase TatA/TatE family subunit [Rubrobacteraceae bacterium]
MLAGLASPSYLILILVLVLLLFGARRIPELAKGLGTGLKELRQGISAGDDAEKVRVEAYPRPDEETGSGRRGL